MPPDTSQLEALARFSFGEPYIFHGDGYGYGNGNGDGNGYGNGDGYGSCKEQPAMIRTVIPDAGIEAYVAQLYCLGYGKAP